MTSVEGPAPSPVAVHILGRAGYVWDADDAKRLRLNHRLVGAMVGGLAGFKQQNDVKGVPLQLSPEEVALGLAKGWLHLANQLAPPLDPAPHADLTLQPADTDEDDLSDCGANEEPEDRRGSPSSWPSWKQGLAGNAAVVIPVTVEDALQQAGPSSSASMPAQQPPATWDFPATAAELQRCRIFADLQSKGYCITGGAKFGADYLVYPSDPSLYHAQFCVRIADWETPMSPVLMAAAARGSHAARKHLLLASLHQVSDSDGNTEQTAVSYVTVAPEAGFG